MSSIASRSRIVAASSMSVRGARTVRSAAGWTGCPRRARSRASRPLGLERSRRCWRTRCARSYDIADDTASSRPATTASTSSGCTQFVHRDATSTPLSAPRYSRPQRLIQSSSPSGVAVNTTPTSRRLSDRIRSSSLTHSYITDARVRHDDPGLDLTSPTPTPTPAPEPNPTRPRARRPTRHPKRSDDTLKAPSQSADKPAVDHQTAQDEARDQNQTRRQRRTLREHLDPYLKCCSDGVSHHGVAAARNPGSSVRTMAHRDAANGTAARPLEAADLRCHVERVRSHINFLELLVKRRRRDADQGVTAVVVRCGTTKGCKTRERERLEQPVGPGPPHAPRIGGHDQPRRR